MDKIKEILKSFKEGLRLELSGLKKLEGAHFHAFSDVFNISENCEIYFNKYNIIIIDTETHNEMSPYLQNKNLILSLDFPEYNTHLWAYKYFNDRILKDYLTY